MGASPEAGAEEGGGGEGCPVRRIRCEDGYVVRNERSPRARLWSGMRKMAQVSVSVWAGYGRE